MYCINEQFMERPHVSRSRRAGPRCACHDPTAAPAYQVRDKLRVKHYSLSIGWSHPTGILAGIRRQRAALPFLENQAASTTYL